MLAGVVGSIGGLTQANIDASWLLVPMMSGTLRHRPDPRRVDRVVRQQVDAVREPVGQNGGVGRALAPEARPRRVAAPLRQRLDLVDADAEPVEEAMRLTRPGLAVGDQRQRRDSARSPGRTGPSAAGLANNARTEVAPADSPNTVTWSGSPPNAAMLSRTQASAASWSRRHRLSSNPAPRSPSSNPPNTPSRYVTLTTTTLPLRGQPRAVVELQLTGAVDERAAGNPDHDRQRAGGIAGRRPHRDGETRLVADLRVVASTTDERAALRRQRTVLDGVADARPRFQRRGRQEPALAHGLLGVGDTAPDVDAALRRAAELPVRRSCDDGREFRSIAQGGHA